LKSSTRLSREEKARQIVISGRVTQLYKDIFKVTGDRGKDYIVSGHCVCPDARKTTYWCKHKLSTLYYSRIKEKVLYDYGLSQV
jgi:hypothetical protein